MRKPSGPVAKVAEARKGFRCTGSGAVRYADWHDVPAGPSVVFRRDFYFSGMMFKGGKSRVCVDHARAMGVIGGEEVK